jgi:hypothetical protein
MAMIAINRIVDNQLLLPNLRVHVVDAASVCDPVRIYKGVE